MKLNEDGTLAILCYRIAIPVWLSMSSTSATLKLSAFAVQIDITRHAKLVGLGIYKTMEWPNSPGSTGS